MIKLHLLLELVVNSRSSAFIKIIVIIIIIVIIMIIIKVKLSPAFVNH